MKLLFLSIDTNNIGGIQTYIKMYQEGLLLKYPKSKIINITINKNNLNLKKILEITINSIKFDKIYVTHVSILNLFFLIFFKKKITIFFYGVDIFSIRGFLVKKIFSNIDFEKYVTCSEYTKKFSIKHYKVKKDRIKVIYPYCKFELDSKSIKNVNLSDNKFIRILTVSRLEGKITKGIWLMLKALKSINKKNIFFDIVGEGSEKNSIINYIINSNLSNVKVHGFQKNLETFYEQTDFSVSITDNAGFGISVLDSLYFNKPCIISKNSASIEIVNNLNYPFLITDENDLDGLIKLLSNINSLNSSYDYKNDLYYKYFSFEKYMESLV